MRLKGLDAQHSRRQIIVNLYKKGMKQVEIAEVTNVTQPYVSRIVTAYRQGGAAAIEPTSAPGAKAKLTAEQLKELSNILKGGAENQGFEGAIWTCGRVAVVIEQHFGVSYGTQHVGRILKKLNYTRQKPQVEDYRKKPQDIEDWQQKKLPELKKKAKREDRLIVFQDEAGFGLLPNLSVTYAPKGQTPIISHESKGYKQLSAAVAISEEGDLYYELRECNFKGNAIARFLNNCWASFRQRLTCIWDGASIHNSEPVKQLLHQQAANPRIWLAKTPAYCPELNAAEQVWNYVKNVLLVNVFCKTLEELKQKVASALDTIKADKELVKSFFRHEKVAFYN